MHSSSGSRKPHAATWQSAKADCRPAQQLQPRIARREALKPAIWHKRFVFSRSAIRRELGPTLALAVPITVGQVSQMLIGFTDTAFIARLGAVPLAAAAFTQGVFHAFYVACLGLLLGPGVFASRDHGAGN